MTRERLLPSSGGKTQDGTVQTRLIHVQRLVVLIFLLNFCWRSILDCKEYLIFVFRSVFLRKESDCVNELRIFSFLWNRVICNKVKKKKKEEYLDTPGSFVSSLFECCCMCDKRVFWHTFPFLQSHFSLRFYSVLWISIFNQKSFVEFSLHHKLPKFSCLECQVDENPLPVVSVYTTMRQG